MEHLWENIYQAWCAYLTEVAPYASADIKAKSIAETLQRFAVETKNDAKSDVFDPKYAGTAYVQMQSLTVRQAYALEKELTAFTGGNWLQIENTNDARRAFHQFEILEAAQGYYGSLNFFEGLYEVELKLAGTSNPRVRERLHTDILNGYETSLDLQRHVKSKIAEYFSKVLTYVPKNRHRPFETFFQLTVVKPVDTFVSYVQRQHLGRSGNLAGFQGLEGVSQVSFQQVQHALFQLGVDLGREKFDLDAVFKGANVELEHTDDATVATRIALDHLRERPDYYDRLERVEKGVFFGLGGFERR